MAANPQLVVRIAASLGELKKNLAEGKNQIETTTASMTKLAASFKGDKLVQQAHNVTAAVAQIGGASKLTGAEQDRVNRVVQAALEKYAALGKEAPAALRQLAADTKRVEAPTQSLSTSFKTLVASWVTAQLTLVALQRVWRTLTAFIGSSVQAFAEQERATKTMVTALEAQGTATPRTIKQYKDLAAQFQRTTTYGDELTLQMQAMLVQVGNVMPSQMKGALAASMDLAAGLGVDLRAATLLVGKAFAGETGSLTRYGIVIDKTKLKTEGAAAVLAAINERFGGQAQAQAETYAGQITQMANAWGDFKEAVGEALTQDPILQAALRGAKAVIVDLGTQDLPQLSLSMRIANALQFGAFPITSKLAEALAHAADSSNKAATAHRRHDIVLGPLKNHIKELTEDQKKAIKAATDLANSLGPLKLAGEVAKLTTALQILRTRGDLSAETLANIGDAAAVAFDKGATLTPELVALALASDKLGFSLSKITKPGLDALPGALELATAATLDFYFQQQALSAQLQQTTDDELASFVTQLLKVGESYDIVGLHAKEFAKKQAPDVSASLDRMSAGFAQLAQIGGGALKGITGFAAQLTSTIKQAVDGAKSAVAGWRQAGEGGAKNFIAGLAGMVPGVGSIVGAVASLFGGLFSKSEGRKQLEAANAEIAKLKEQVVVLYGSTAQAEQIAARLGINFQAIWSNQNQAGLAYVKEQVDALAKALAEQSQAAVDLGATMTQRLGADGSAAIQSMLDKLASLGGLSAEVQAELLAMAGPDFKAMEEAAARYGLAQDALGNGYWQAKLDTQFLQVVKDFELLTNAGANAGAVINAMGPQVATLVGQAIRYGTELPAGMRPIIDSMQQAGLLVDASGKQFDASKIKGLTYAETITQGIDRVVDKLQELIDALTKGVVGGFNNVIDAADRFGRTRIKIPVDFEFNEPSNSSGSSSSESYAGGSGGFRDFGVGTAAVLHGIERVQTPAQARAEMRPISMADLVAALRQVGSRGGTVQFNVTTLTNGGDAVRQLVHKEIGPLFLEYLNGNKSGSLTELKRMLG